LSTVGDVDVGRAGRTGRAASARAGAGACHLVDTRAAFAAMLESARGAGRTVGLVPTMGALHEGHASLVRRAAGECDVAAVTVFVNPLQFDRAADLAAYPRTLEADVAAAAEAGATVVFAPSAHEMFGPTGHLDTTVHVSGLADRLEGASRPGHFDGVATIVAKLLALAGPCRAYFGEKDFQQLAVVRRLVADLSLPVRVVGCPTVRAEDGLALSSRNALLTAEERAVAPLLQAALRSAAQAASGERDPAVLAGIVAGALAAEPRFRLDRVDVVDAATLGPPGRDPGATGELRILAAAWLGRARLIDNVGVAL
jgi:pantoate--beta-alanine ligase